MLATAFRVGCQSVRHRNALLTRMRRGLYSRQTTRVRDAECGQRAFGMPNAVAAAEPLCSEWNSPSGNFVYRENKSDRKCHRCEDTNRVVGWECATQALSGESGVGVAYSRCTTTT